MHHATRALGNHEKYLIDRTMFDQLSLFGAASRFPPGFRYQAEVLSVDAEQQLVEVIRTLPLREFQFHGYVGKRRVLSYGSRYDYEDEALHSAEDIPDFLLPARDAAAAFAGLPASDIKQALITEYDVGASIGWHRDKAVFGDVIGLSLLSPCTFRLRRKMGDRWERVSLTAVPRSAYLLSGPARTEWEHSILAVDALRYSITFRTVRQARSRKSAVPRPQD